MQLVDTSKDTIKTIAGQGKAGFADGSGREAALSEPGGLARGPNDTVFVADTNNHLIRIFDAARGSLETLELLGVPPPRKAGRVADEITGQAVPPGALFVSVDPTKVSKCFI